MCPSDEARQAGLESIKSDIKMLLNTSLQRVAINDYCGPGQWHRVAYINMMIHSKTAQSNGRNTEPILAGVAVELQLAHVKCFPSVVSIAKCAGGLSPINW